MSNSKIYLITLLLLHCSLIFSIKERNFLYLEADSTATCSCIVKSGFEAWGAYCTNNCNSQTGCNTYGSFCTWSVSTTNTSSTNTTTTIACPNNCSGHGTCNNSTGICTCSTGYSSSNCSLMTCPNSCSSHGTCNTNTGVCTCSSGWSGTNCGTSVALSCPNNCFGHGVCNTSTGMCTCNSGWSSVDCGTSTSSSNTSSSNTSSSNQTSSNFEHSIYALTWTAWNPTAIFNLFKPACLGLAKQIYLSFGGPSQSVGIDFSGQSPNTTVWYQNQNTPAINVYKQAIVGLNLAAGVQTLISIGGWTYRTYFAFLGTLNATAMAAWAQKCKQVVDSFGAQGIDIDFEADTVQEWNDIMVKNNVIGALRKAMPSPQYIIKLTLPYGAAINLTSNQIATSFSPAISGGWGAQCSVSLIKQNWLDVDSVNIMSYGSDSNLDPMQALNLNKQQINQYMGLTNSQNKLNLGGMIGPQPGCTTNWCDWQISHATSAATYVKQQGYHGMFWWPDSGTVDSQIPFYQEAYKQMYGKNPTPVSVPGVC